MPNTFEDVVRQLDQLQSSIWQAVCLTFSEASGQSVTFSPVSTEAAGAAAVLARAASEQLIVQFSFASRPESWQLLLLGRDLFTGLAALLKGEELETADEALIPEVRRHFEAIVQGICLAIGNIHNEPMVASGLSLRFESLILPSNMEKSPELVATTVSVTAEGATGELIWLFDRETAYTILNVPMEEDAPPLPAAPSAPEATAGQPAFGADETGGLDVLFDVPLEISVELGRVKMLLRDVVDLGSGSIVEIDKAAGEPVDVLVNGRLVARGEVVVIEDNFGVRLTEIMSQQDRLNRLNEAA
jgi:flagellar motor switch protein FliN/FliY